jgi:glutathione peroxidase-family protein
MSPLIRTTDSLFNLSPLRFSYQDILAKSDVNGSNTNEVFKFLKSKKSGVLGTTSIKWNFTKFLVDKQGNVVERYSSTAKPNSIAPKIEELLKA